MRYIVQDFKDNLHNLDKFPDGGLLIDLGANVGVFSIVLSKLLGFNAIAVEPMRNTFNCLQDNIKVNGARNVKPLKLAIGNYGDKVDLFQNPINSGSSSKFQFLDNFPSETVRCETLDSLIEPYESIDLLKVDIEGSEYEMIPAFKAWHKIKNLTIELHQLPLLTDAENKTLIRNAATYIENKFQGKNLMIQKEI